MPTGSRFFVNIFMIIAHPVLPCLRNGQLLSKQTEFQDSECRGTVTLQPQAHIVLSSGEGGCRELDG